MVIVSKVGRMCVVEFIKIVNVMIVEVGGLEDVVFLMKDVG